MSEYTREITPALLAKYNVPGPYYTSYPVLSQWGHEVTGSDFAGALGTIGESGESRPILLYVHFPFCAKQCYYCICNSVIGTRHDDFQRLLGYWGKEIRLIEHIWAQRRSRPIIDMIHLGGGTPNLMNEEEFRLLMGSLGRIVDFQHVKECSLEVDVRTVNLKKLESFAGAGVTRLSFGIQDFDPRVQKAINREQSLELVQSIFVDSIRKKYRGSNFDILYGLPLQTRESFRKTMQEVLRLAPERITLLKYAHVPDRKTHQNHIRLEDLPTALEAENFYLDAFEAILAQGYEYIGLNHFARKDDPLATAKKQGGLWRNFIGFTWGGAHDLLGIGPTSTSDIQGYYFQNQPDLEAYAAALDAGRLPVLRGYRPDQDELYRREIINTLLCAVPLDLGKLKQKYVRGIPEAFPGAWIKLQGFAEEGFLKITSDKVAVTPLGEMFVRHICRLFDRHGGGA